MVELPDLSCKNVRKILELLTGLDGWDGSRVHGTWVREADVQDPRRLKARVVPNESCGEFKVEVYED